MVSIAIWIGFPLHWNLRIFSVLIGLAALLMVVCATRGNPQAFVNAETTVNNVLFFLGRSLDSAGASVLYGQAVSGGARPSGFRVK
jgi:hypothetical protein